MNINQSIIIWHCYFVQIFFEWFSTPYSPYSSRSHRSEIRLQRKPHKRSEPLKYKVNLINKTRWPYWDSNLWPSDQNPTTPSRPTTSHIIFNGWKVALFRDVSHVLCSQLRDLRLFCAHALSAYISPWMSTLHSRAICNNRAGKDGFAMFLVNMDGCQMVFITFPVYGIWNM